MTRGILTKQVASFIYKMIRPFPGGISVMFLVACIWAIDLSLRPYILKIILNRVAEVPAQDVFDYLTLPACAYVFMSFLVSTGFRLYGYFVEIKMIPYLRRRIALSSIDTLLKQSHQYHQRHFSGSLVNKINDLVSSIPDMLQTIIDRFFSHGLALVVAIFTLWHVHIRFALFILVWTILFLGGALIFSKRIARLSDIWSEWGSTITGKMVDVLSNILPIKLFARETTEISFLRATFSEALKAEEKLQWSFFWIWVSYGYSFVIVLGLNLYFLIQGRQEGWVTVGDFALVLTGPPHEKR